MTELRNGMPNVTDTWNDLGDTETVPAGPPLQELGVTGLKRVGGYIEDEFLPALRGRKAVKVYREMSENDSIIGALLFAIDKLIRQVDWEVEPASQSPDDLKNAEFLKSCMDDMSMTWDDFIGEALSMIVYGWSWHEIVYKKRVGPWEKDGAKRSEFTDGMIGWRKIPIRAQETMFRWIFDEKGGVKGLVQMAPPTYSQTSLSIERSLLFRTKINKGNPEGRSLIRSAYRSWYMKKRLEEFEAIGVERDLAGMPVGRLPSEYFTAASGTPQNKMLMGFKKMVQGVRRDENEGLVLPVAYDENKNQLFDFELMSSSGSRQFDTNALIQRYEQRILMSVLADFILVGHEAVGSYALHTDKTGIFRAALNSIVKSLADTLNRHAVPRLFAINGIKPEKLPKFQPGDIDPPDLNQLAQFITATAGAGMQWFPDPELEKFVRNIAKLPELSQEQLEIKSQMFDQQLAMEFATSQMGLLGMQQKAEMTAQGFTPEQAELASQMPNRDMQAYEAQTQMDAEGMRMAHPVGQMQSAKEEEQLALQAQGKTGDIAAQDEAAANQHAREKEKVALQEKMADSGFKREKEKQTLAERQADAAHKREKEKADLGEKTAANQHKRETEKIDRDEMRAHFQSLLDKDKTDRDIKTMREKGKLQRVAAKDKPKKEKK